MFRTNTFIFLGNEDYCYQSFASDDLDTAVPPSLADSSKKNHHRRHERTSSLQAIDRLNTKIQCTKESIRKEQTARDGKSCTRNGFIIAFNLLFLLRFQIMSMNTSSWQLVRTSNNCIESR